VLLTACSQVTLRISGRSLPSRAVRRPDSLAAPRCKSMVLSRYSAFSRQLIRPEVRASLQHPLNPADWYYSPGSLHDVLPFCRLRVNGAWAAALSRA
jgi:hypothetical protein